MQQLFKKVTLSSEEVTLPLRLLQLYLALCQLPALAILSSDNSLTVQIQHPRDTDVSTQSL